ncbi:Opacity protein [Yoonia rosea]|uniref:Opacity protein n=1 Tax=Yoonia rosea TaxID=287098 RepID=A0A1R3XGA8_9RHOB|nr:outer membrane beta-barrel protein [Yoonia rosea]SIT90360.1 Opacity protein [Yoonia rosea]
MTHSKNFLATLLVAAPLGMAASGALAGGLSEPVAAPAAVIVPVAPVSTDWTGFYAGAQLGYGDVDSDDLDNDTNGALYGVHAGYLYDFGSLVVGGEIDYDGTSITGESAGGDVDFDSVARAKVRMGYDAGSWLPYITAGVAQVNTSGGLDADDTGNFAGLGIEYKRGDNWRLGWEVLHHQFEDFDGNDGLDIDATTAALRVSYVF